MARTIAHALLLAALLTGAASADPLPTQGQPCTAQKGCAAKLQCTARKGAASTCERPCAKNADCPADQRCVKDAGALVCHAITDDDMNPKRPTF